MGVEWSGMETYWSEVESFWNGMETHWNEVESLGMESRWTAIWNGMECHWNAFRNGMQSGWNGVVTGLECRSNLDPRNAGGRVPYEADGGVCDQWACPMRTGGCVLLESFAGEYCLRNGPALSRCYHYKENGHRNDPRIRDADLAGFAAARGVVCLGVEGVWFSR